MKRSILLKILLFTLALQTLVAQEGIVLGHQHIGLKDGLSSMEVFTALQDYRGFMWFGTRNGLNRYDGTEIIVYDKSNGLRGGRIAKIAEDCFHRIWIVYAAEGWAGGMKATGEIDLLDIETGEIKSFEQSFPTAPFSPSDIGWISSDEEGGIVIYLYSKLIYRFDKEGNFRFEFNSNEDNEGGYSEIYNLVLRAKGDYIWTSHPKYSFYKGKKLDLTGTLGLTNEEFQIISLNKDGVELIDADERFFYVKHLHDDGHVSFDSLPNIVPGLNILKYPEICLWFSLYQDWTLFTYSEGAVFFGEKQIYIVPNAVADLRGSRVIDFMVDRQGSFWVCTGNGVHRFHFSKNKFVNYFQAGGGGPYIEMGNQARAIYEDRKGNLYASIYRHWVRRDGATGKEEWSFKQRETMKLFELDNGFLSFGSGLFSHGYTGQNIECQEKLDTKSLFHYRGHDWSSLQLGPTQYLVGTFRGVYFYDIEKKDGWPLIACKGILPEMTLIYQVIKRKATGQYWAVGETGLYLISKEFCIESHYWDSAPDPEHRLPITGLYDVFEDDEGILWLATNGEGLIRFDVNKQDIKVFNNQAGLPSNILYSIQPDSFDCLWISSDKGLVRFNKSTSVVNFFTQTDGLPCNEFNRVSSHKGFSGKLYFGGVNGITSFNPRDFLGQTGNQNDNPIEIATFQQFLSSSRKLENRTAQLLANRHIVMNPGDQFFQIKVAILDYVTPVLYFMYQIEGLDDRWYDSKDGFIRISGLPYGHFTLRIKALNNAGNWTSQELVLPIDVLKPFYLRAWFLLLVLLATILAIWAYIKYRTVNILKSRELLEKTVNMRTSELSIALGDKEVLLKEVHHRVKNNLQVISGLLDLQQRGLGDERIKSEFDIAKLRVKSVALIHQILYEKDNFSEMELMGMTKKLFSQVRSVYSNDPSKVKLSLPEGGSHILNLNTTIALGLILNELMTNSFKYAFDGLADPEVKIQFFENQDEGYRYTLVYADNGKGLPEGFDVSKIKSLGFVIIKDLTRQLKGKFEYSSENGFSIKIRFNGVNG